MPLFGETIINSKPQDACLKASNPSPFMSEPTGLGVEFRVYGLGFRGLGFNRLGFRGLGFIGLGF